jgi:hypothetical protein
MFSVQTAPNVPVDNLARAGRFPNRQISVTTVEMLRGAGVSVDAPTPGARGHHGTLVVPYPAPMEVLDTISRRFSQRPNRFAMP